MKCKMCAAPTGHPRGWYCSPTCRIMSRVVIDHINGCWLWVGPKKPGPHPYGLIRVRKKTLIAHRYSYESLVREIPKDNVIMHSCNNAMCVNPDHLVAGTQRENVAEQISRGAFQKPLGFQQAVSWIREHGSTDLVAFLAHHFDKPIDEVMAAI